MNATTFIIDAFRVFAEAVAPFRAALADRESFRLFLVGFGWELDPTIDDVGFASVQAAFIQESYLLDQIIGTDLQLATAIPRLVASLLGDWTPAADWPTPLNSPAFWSEFPRELVDSIEWDMLASCSPALFGLLRFGAVLREQRQPASVAAGSTPARLEYLKRSIDWNQLVSLVSDPARAFTSAYRWNSSTEPLRASELLGAIAALFELLPVSAVVGEASEPVYARYFDRALPTSPPSIEHLSVMPHVLYDESGSPLDLLRVSLNAVPIPAAGEHTGNPVGISIFPIITGNGQQRVSLSSGVTLTLQGDYAAVPIFAEIRPGKVTFDLADATMASVSGIARLEAKRKDPPWCLLGSATGPRLEVSSAHFAFSAKGAPANPTFDIEVGMDEAALVVDFASGDGFLKKIFGASVQRVGVSLLIGWSSCDGFHIASQGSFHLIIPVHETLLSIITIDRVLLELAVDAETKRILFGAAITGCFDLGPISATVDGVGIQMGVKPSSNGSGNLGSIDLSLDFLPPSGAGLTLSGGPIIGGGYLEFNNEEKSYAGILALKAMEIGLTAIALITTKMPDGSEGFSLLVSICATFNPPIQLSYGFTLSGVGGLVGINRTMDVDALRVGIKNRTLDSILFPDPATVIANAPKILSDMRAVFPPYEGRFVVGPMVQLGWGTPNIIIAEIGIFLDLPNPIRIALLGQLEAVLPERDSAVVFIHMDILGVLDLEKKELTFQALLYDSRLLSYPMYGDSAFLLAWGSDPRFALSLGGFHPKFTPPAPPTVFANLKRLTICISSGSTLQLSCSAYQALTPNTLQFGARVDLYASEGDAKVKGYLTFDTLIYFSPFTFEAQMNAEVEIIYKGEELASIDLSLYLSGPTPWIARGKAKIHILFISATVKFCKTWGDDQQATLPARDPWIEFQEALSNPDCWGAVLPAGRTMVEALQLEKAPAVQKQDPSAQPKVPPLVVHPSGRLEVRQKVVPLGKKLSLAANAPIAGHDLFDIEDLCINGTSLKDDIAPLEESFARGQWEDLGAGALSLPSFEKMKAGVSASLDLVDLCGDVESRGMEYESILIGKDLVSEKPRVGWLPWHIARIALKAGVRRNTLRRNGPLSRFASVHKGANVRVREEGYCIANATNLQRADVKLEGEQANRRMTRTMADQILSGLQGADGEYVVMPESEVAA